MLSDVPVMYLICIYFLQKKQSFCLVPFFPQDEVESGSGWLPNFTVLLVLEHLLTAQINPAKAQFTVSGHPRKNDIRVSLSVD